ncbi:MAG: SBBP repeat-containing protein [candidate division WOR-3 bacterium]|nr:SBBP repeat-containing protein [candidate division WOR-3 bacterium]
MKKALVCLMMILPGIMLAQVTEEWVARYFSGFTETWKEAVAIVVDDEGNVYVTGHCPRLDTVNDTIEQNIDIVTVKYNSQGDEQWVQSYNGPGDDTDWPFAMAIDSSGNVYVTGYSVGSETGTDYITIKYSSGGEEEWVARYDGPISGSDFAWDLAIDTESNVYVTGSSEGEGSEGDCVTIRYNSTGKEVWVERYNGTRDGFDVGTSIETDHAGNVYVAGEVSNLETWSDFLIIKYSSMGYEKWTASYDGPANHYDHVTDLAWDGSGNVYVTGVSASASDPINKDYATCKFSASGQMRWAARYDGPSGTEDEPVTIVVNDWGSVYVTGHSYKDKNDWDFLTIKYSSIGEEQWVKRYEGDAGVWDEAHDMAMDHQGNIYVTGYSFNDETSIDCTTIKYSPEGEELWIADYNGSEYGIDKGNAIVLDKLGNVYVSGGCTNYPEETMNYLTIKYSQGPGVAEAYPDLPGHRLEVAQLTPEPVITYTLPSSSSISLKVYDVTGKLVRTLVSGSQEAGTHTVTWDGRDNVGQQVSSGLYFIRIAAPGFSRFAKVVMIR